VLNVWSRSRRTPGWAHILLAGQVAPAVALGGGWLLVAAAFAIALVLWIVFIAVLAAIMTLIVVGLLSAAAS
jgi:hypothetical protein